MRPPSPTRPCSPPSRPPRPPEPHRTLFLPSKHDPTTFAASQRALEARSARSQSSSVRSDQSAPPSRERRRRRGPGTATSATSAESGSLGADGCTRTSAKAAANSFIADIKRTYRDISTLETELQACHAAAAQDQERIALPDAISSAVDQIGKHKHLAWLHYHFYQLCLGPRSLASWRTLPTEYAMAGRLWQVACYPLLEQLRHLAIRLASSHAPPSSSSGSPPSMTVSLSTSTPPSTPTESLMDHLIDAVFFIYYLLADLVENELFRSLRTIFRESLGDLARYRIAILEIEAQLASRPDGQRVRNKPPRSHPLPPLTDEEGAFDKASIGSDALGDWELDESQVWSETACRWYVLALSDVPGTGRLHHHLALLSRGHELRVLYHLVKALAASHPFSPAREPLKDFFSSRLQQTRTGAADAVTQFIWLHGFLFRRKKGEQWDTALAHFLDKMSNAEPSQADLMRMLAINVAAIFEYGADGAALRAVWDGSTTEAQPHEGVPLHVHRAAQLAFGMFRTLLSRSMQEGPSAYVTGWLTFLHTGLSIPSVAAMLQRYVPWEQLADFSHHLPQGLPDPSVPGAEGKAARKAAALAAKTRGASKIGSSPPLPEDWAMRGMGWVGRKVYERGFWTVPPSPPPTAQARKMWKRTAWPAPLRFQTELEALSYDDVAVWDPPPDDDEAAPSSHASSLSAVSAGSMAGCSSTRSFPPGLTITELVDRVRWNRLGHLLVSLVRFVPGVARAGDGLKLVPPLTDDMARWAVSSPFITEDLANLQTHGRVPEKVSLSIGAASKLPSTSMAEAPRPSRSEAIESDEDAVQARHRLLRQILAANKAHRRDQAAVAPLPRGPNAQPGKTTLVLDTNVLLVGQDEFDESALARLLRAGWDVVVPLAVVTELEGLTRSHTPATARAARRALAELEPAVRTRAVTVQTSRFVCVSDLTIRSEQCDFGPIPALDLPRARSLDDVILRIAVWQATHRGGRHRHGSSSSSSSSSSISCSNLGPPTAAATSTCASASASKSTANSTPRSAPSPAPGFCSAPTPASRVPDSVPADGNGPAEGMGDGTVALVPAAVPAVLLTHDTNLRIKARAYGVDAAVPAQLAAAWPHLASSDL